MRKVRYGVAARLGGGVRCRDLPAAGQMDSIEATPVPALLGAGEEPR